MCFKLDINSNCENLVDKQTLYNFPSLLYLPEGFYSYLRGRTVCISRPRHHFFLFFEHKNYCMRKRAVLKVL